MFAKSGLEHTPPKEPSNLRRNLFFEKIGASFRDRNMQMTKTIELLNISPAFSIKGFETDGFLKTNIRDRTVYPTLFFKLTTFGLIWNFF